MSLLPFSLHQLDGGGDGGDSGSDGGGDYKAGGGTVCQPVS